MKLALIVMLALAVVFFTIVPDPYGKIGASVFALNAFCILTVKR
jgi:hypothetical protein